MSSEMESFCLVQHAHTLHACTNKHTTHTTHNLPTSHTQPAHIPHTHMHHTHTPHIYTHTYTHAHTHTHLCLCSGLTKSIHPEHRWSWKFYLQIQSGIGSGHRDITEHLLYLVFLTEYWWPLCLLISSALIKAGWSSIDGSTRFVRLAANKDDTDTRRYIRGKESYAGLQARGVWPLHSQREGTGDQ